MQCTLLPSIAINRSQMSSVSQHHLPPRHILYSTGTQPTDCPPDILKKHNNFNTGARHRFLFRVQLKLYAKAMGSTVVQVRLLAPTPGSINISHSA